MGWFCYIVECADNTYYTGITTDIERRISAHNAGKGAKYVKGRLPVHVVYTEECENRSDASRRELEIKSLDRQEKIALISR
ncbi:MAG: GIY-YIG nuclease family protein [Alcanivorax sp.]